MNRRKPPKGYKYRLVYDPDGGVFVQLRRRRAKLGVFSAPVDAIWIAYGDRPVSSVKVAKAVLALEHRNGLV